MLFAYLIDRHSPNSAVPICHYVTAAPARNPDASERGIAGVSEERETGERAETPRLRHRQQKC